MKVVFDTGGLDRLRGLRLGCALLLFVGCQTTGLAADEGGVPAHGQTTRVADETTGHRRQVAPASTPAGGTALLLPASLTDGVDATGEGLFVRRAFAQVGVDGPAERSGGWIAPLLASGLLSSLLVVFLQNRRLRRESDARAAAETALARSRSLLQQSQALAQVGNWELETTSMRAEWSEEVFRIVGIEPRDDAGPCLLETLLHPDDRDGVLASLQNAAGGGDRHDMEYRIVRPDGETRWVHCEAERIVGEDDQAPKLRGVIQDITHRKLDQLRLREREEHYRTIIEGAPTGVWLIGPDRRTVQVNQCLCALLGYRADEMIGRKPMEFVDDANRQIFLAQTARIELSEHREYQIELRHKDGRRIPTLFNATTLRDTDGEVMASVAFVTDLTEQQAAEIVLRRAQKMDAIGQMAGGIAHDFNNILGIILGNLDLLERRLGGDGKAVKWVKSIERSAQRGAELTRQMLGFSRLQPAASEIVEINRVIHEMEGLIARTVTPEVVLDLRLSGESWLVRTDLGDLQDALLNLVLNARDAMPNGGRLTIETSNRRIDVAESDRYAGMQAGEYLLLAVTDTGPGIPVELQERVFEPFYTTKTKGTGLGLAMVYGFVKRSRGYVNVASANGDGARLELFIPRALGQEQNKPLRTARTEAPEPGSERILVVDDEVDLLSLAGEALRELGYDVVTAANGRQAMQLLEDDGAFDLLFSDIVMPGGMSGYELAEQARRLHPELAILLTSGYAEREQPGPLQSGGDLSLVVKPYVLDEVTKRIRSLLDEKAARAADNRQSRA